jgi:phosphatidylinositol alpha-1,6-mannosyltransferase
LQQIYPEVHYLMVGLATEREAFHSLARTLGVAERVHFLGAVPLPTLVEAYNACDVHVMASRHARDGDFEGFGIAVVEAALCGKPSVVSGSCGLEEAIVPNQTGLVAPKEDTAATAATLARLLHNRKELERLGRKAREYALANQTWSQSAAAYEEVLQAALA